MKKFLVEISECELRRMKSNAEHEDLSDEDFIEMSLSKSTDSHGQPIDFLVHVKEIHLRCGTCGGQL